MERVRVIEDPRKVEGLWTQMTREKDVIQMGRVASIKFEKIGNISCRLEIKYKSICCSFSIPLTVHC